MLSIHIQGGETTYPNSISSTNLPRVPIRTSATLVFDSKVAVASTTLRLADLLAPIDCTELFTACPKKDPSPASPNCTPRLCRIATAPLDLLSIETDTFIAASAALLRSIAGECIMVETAIRTNSASPRQSLWTSEARCGDGEDCNSATRADAGVCNPVGLGLDNSAILHPYFIHPFPLID